MQKCAKFLYVCFGLGCLGGVWLCLIFHLLHFAFGDTTLYYNDALGRSFASTRFSIACTHSLTWGRSACIHTFSASTGLTFPNAYQPNNMASACDGPSPVRHKPLPLAF